MLNLLKMLTAAPVKVGPASEHDVLRRHGLSFRRKAVADDEGASQNFRERRGGSPDHSPAHGSHPGPAHFLLRTILRHHLPEFCAEMQRNVLADTGPRLKNIVSPQVTK